MAKKKIGLSLAAMHRICEEAGAKRVSDSAMTELAIVLEDIGVKIAKDAYDYTKFAKRQTVKARDIAEVAKKANVLNVALVNS
jgi:histone H3/H4